MGGRNAQRKGLASLFEAAPKVLQALPTAEFLVVGDDPVIGNLTKRIAPDILSKFRFINWVSNADMPQYYQRASVLVMPSLVEAFGVVAIEAMASGTAVIATNNGGTTEFIDDGVNGVLIQPKDHEGLSEKIILLLRDTRLRDVVIDNGKATAASFNVEKMKKETYKIYNLASETS